MADEEIEVPEQTPVVADEAETDDAAPEEAGAEPAAEEAVAEEGASEEGPGESAPESPRESEAEPKRKRKRLSRALRHKHVRPKREQSAKRKPIVRTPAAATTPGRRQERRGVVVSDKGDKSIVVQVETVRIHAKYKKVIRRSNKLHAHDEQNAAGIGDVVRIVETRPLSKTKRWRLAEIVQKAR